MAVIDQNLSWDAVERRLEIETDPVLRRNLEQLLLHMKAEAEGDLETLMVTVAEQASYTAFGAPPANSPPYARDQWSRPPPGTFCTCGVRPCSLIARTAVSAEPAMTISIVSGGRAALSAMILPARRISSGRSKNFSEPA